MAFFFCAILRMRCIFLALCDYINDWHQTCTTRSRYCGVLGHEHLFTIKVRREVREEIAARSATAVKLLRTGSLKYLNN